MAIKIALAIKKDKPQLIEYFKHYKNKEIIDQRVSCYLCHNFTIVAKDNSRLVGILQWSIKEDPKAGVVEFEEVHILENYRKKGISSLMVKFAIQAVRDYFKKLNLKPRKIYLFVSKENKIARALYEKFGFKPVAQAGNLFSDHEIELFYCLNM